MKACHDKCKVDKNHLIELENIEDPQHLPNNKSVKCYLRCGAELSEGVDPKSKRVLISKFTDFFMDSTKEEQRIFVLMGRGCINRNINDPLDFVYELTVFTKQNDNEVNICKRRNNFQNVMRFNFFSIFISSTDFISVVGWMVFFLSILVYSAIPISKLCKC